jgi:hypothetical protein
MIKRIKWIGLSSERSVTLEPLQMPHSMEVSSLILHQTIFDKEIYLFILKKEYHIFAL